jgi:hypothetical protein
MLKTNMFNTIIIDNFFDNYPMLEQEFKKVPIYAQKDFPEFIAEGVSWPGRRSKELALTHPFMWQLTNKEILTKSENERLVRVPFKMALSMHLRLHEDQALDYIHTDSTDLTMIVFLSKTNLNSGLSIYNINKEETHHIKFVQNRAVIFDGKQNHKSSLNYGDNIDNGRITLNGFINFL